MLYHSTCLLLLAGLLISCAPSPPKATPAPPSLASYFAPLPVGDTLSVTISRPATTDTITWSEMLRFAPLPLFDSIADLGDTSDIGLRPVGVLPVTERYDSYLVEMLFAWYIHRGLLLYDKQTERFVQAFPLSIFYGGEGGQVATEAYRADLDNDGYPDWLIREMAHSTRLDDAGEPYDTYETQIRALRWQDSRYRPYTLPDTTGIAARFPQQWTWW